MSAQMNPVVARAEAKAKAVNANKAKTEAKEKAKVQETKVEGPKVPSYGPQPIGRRPKKKNKPCSCGCGELCGRAFAPGHDGRVSGWIRRLGEDLTLDQIPGPAQELIKAWDKAGRPGGIEHPALKQVALDLRTSKKQ